MAVVVAPLVGMTALVELVDAMAMGGAVTLLAVACEIFVSSLSHTFPQPRHEDDWSDVRTRRGRARSSGSASGLFFHTHLLKWMLRRSSYLNLTIYSAGTCLCRLVGPNCLKVLGSSPRTSVLHR